MKRKTISIFFLILVLVSCSKESTQTPVEVKPTPEPKFIEGRATIRGTATFKGKLEKGSKNPALSSPDCHAKPVDENQWPLRVKKGKLANLFVYLKGVPAQSYPVPSHAARLDQKGCAYIPRVLGVQAGQTIEISNSDPTLHNVHSMSDHFPFNFGMPKPGMVVTKTFSNPEVMAMIKCDVHPWMRAYVGVLDHPFFAVSKADGSFEIKKIPAGTFTIVAWHERLGDKEQEITLSGDQTQTVTFKY